MTSGREVSRLVGIVKLSLAFSVMTLSGFVLVANELPAEGARPPEVWPDTPATAMSISKSPANNSPTLVADPTDARVVVMANRLDRPDYSCALHLSGDGGRSWAPASPVPKLPEGAEKCYAPEVDFDRHGMLYYLFVGLAGGGNRPMGVFITKSADRGRTFTAPTRLLGPLNFSVRMAIDRSLGGQGRIHVIWVHATNDVVLGGFAPTPNPILAAHSDDGGRTFSRPVQVSDPERKRVVGPALSLGADHAVHVVYYDLRDDARDYQGLEGPTYEDRWSLVLASSTMGARFNRGVVVDDHIVPTERIMLIFTTPAPAAAVLTNGELCVAWTDSRFGDADVLLRCSTHHRRSWTSPLRLNRDARGNGSRQYLPHLSVSRGGRLDAVYLDRHADPANTRNDVAYTYSTDRGRHFIRPLRLDRMGSDARIGPRYVGPAAEGLVEFGGRLGLLSKPSAAVAAWTDTRNSERGGGQDVFTAQVELPRSLGLRVWPAVVVAGAIGFGAVLLLRRGRRRPPPVPADLPFVHAVSGPAEQ